MTSQLTLRQLQRRLHEGARSEEDHAVLMKLLSAWTFRLREVDERARRALVTLGRDWLDRPNARHPDFGNIKPDDFRPLLRDFVREYARAWDCSPAEQMAAFVASPDAPSSALFLDLFTLAVGFDPSTV